MLISCVFPIWMQRERSSYSHLDSCHSMPIFPTIWIVSRNAMILSYSHHLLHPWIFISTLLRVFFPHSRERSTSAISPISIPTTFFLLHQVVILPYSRLRSTIRVVLSRIFEILRMTAGNLYTERYYLKSIFPSINSKLS